MIGVHNPYLEAFSKYVELADMPWGVKEWEPRGGGMSEIVAGGYNVDRTINTYTAKAELQHRCAWAVPNEQAIRAIADLKMPVVEMGAGTGYWAWMLQNEGVDVKAFDSQPNGNHWCSADHWAPVRQGSHEVLWAYTNHALMLCWPPYDEAMAIDCLEAYKGDVLIYIGEGPSGCTGDNAFHQALGSDYWDGEAEDFIEAPPTQWTEELTVAIPQWPGLHDFLTIFRRK